jgi:glycosyltransferase involved in cell wall biosynthesis
MEKANQFDLIHNHFDFLPLTYSGLIQTPMLTTIHGFSSPRIIPVYKKYDNSTHYVSISNADRHPDLHYLSTIYHGIDPDDFVFSTKKENYLLYFGRIHPDKGAHTAIEIARQAGYTLKMAGLIQDQNYFDELIKPHMDDEQVIYLGNAVPVLRNELLSKAKALLHPISFDEPFGLSIIESMMCGTPVIAFNRGSMAEIIVDGHTGFLVSNISEAVKAIEKKLDQIDSQICRDYATVKFSADRMIDEYINVYTEILDDRKSQ